MTLPNTTTTTTTTKTSSADLLNMIKKGKDIHTSATTTTTTSPPLPSNTKSPPPQPTSTAATVAAPRQPTPFEDDFGIRGLLESIRRLPADRNYWAIGADLESLNMPLESTASGTASLPEEMGKRLGTHWSPFYGDTRRLPPPVASSSMTLAASGLALLPPAYCQFTLAQQEAMEASLPAKMPSMTDACLLLIFYLYSPARNPSINAMDSPAANATDLPTTTTSSAKDPKRLAYFEQARTHAAQNLYLTLDNPNYSFMRVGLQGVGGIGASTTAGSSTMRIAYPLKPLSQTFRQRTSVVNWACAPLP